MTPRQWVLVDVAGAVRVLTMNRPEARNALNTALIEALYGTLCEADADPSVRAVVLTGADPAFCAGVDLKQAQSEGSAARSAVVLEELLPASGEFALSIRSPGTITPPCAGQAPSPAVGVVVWATSG